MKMLNLKNFKFAEFNPDSGFVAVEWCCPECDGEFRAESCRPSTLEKFKNLSFDEMKDKFLGDAEIEERLAGYAKTDIRKSGERCKSDFLYHF
jgi:hypothetical protein